MGADIAREAAYRFSPEVIDRYIAANFGKLTNRQIGKALGRSAHQIVGRARQLGLVKPVVWTDRELALLRAHYASGDSAAIDALVAVTGRPRWQITAKAHQLGIAARKTPDWTDADTERLSQWWGRLPDATVAKRLGRTVNACKIRAQRALGRCRRDNIDGWTGRGIARLMGVDDHKVIRQWIANGWLKATHAPFLQGAGKVRVVSEPALIRFLRACPHEYDRARVHDPSGYYHRIADAAWRADPIYSNAEAAAKVGIHLNTLERFRREGRIGGIRAHDQGGAAEGVWKYRQSDLDAYQPRARKPPTRTIRSAALIAEGIAWVRPIRTWPAQDTRYGRRQESAACRAVGIAWWRTEASVGAKGGVGK
jgi:hypothetical protein